MTPPILANDLLNVATIISIVSGCILNYSGNPFPVFPIVPNPCASSTINNAFYLSHNIRASFKLPISPSAE